MNYLAHFHLADGDEGLLIGALLGDYVKGPLKGEYPAGWERGIALHRRIDADADNHPLRRRFRERLPAALRRYTPIALDVVGDHFLSRHWTHYHHQSLDQFSQYIFQLFAHNHAVPEMARQRMAELARYDVFNAYADWQTIDGALARISQRLRRDNPLDQAGALLRPHYDDLERLFLDTYPDLIASAVAFRREASRSVTNPARQRN